MITNCKNGISSWELDRALGVTQKTAWFMLHRVRLGMQVKHTGKLSGEVEVDESFIGGKARNMHQDVKARKIQGRRGHKAKPSSLPCWNAAVKCGPRSLTSGKRNDFQAIVREHVEPKSALYSDALKSYDGLDGEFVHRSSIMLSSMSMRTYIQTDWRTSGHF